MNTLATGQTRGLYSREARSMYLFYSLALSAYYLALLPTVVYRTLRYRRAGTGISGLHERFGRLPSSVNPDHRRSIWIHAVSVGEVLAARSLLLGLREAYPRHRLLLSTTTSTGQAVAGKLGDEVDGIFYAPFDLPPFIARTLDRVAPDLLVIVDTEIWPNLLRACRRRGVKTVLVNGRLSTRSYRGYRLARPFMRRVLHDIDRVCAQTELWGRRFRDLGFSPAHLTVTGSLKFDALGLSATGADLHVGDHVLRYFQFADGRSVLIAASTLRGEEEPVLRAFRCIQAQASTADTLLIVAPRHPERFEEAYRLATREGFSVVRRTELAPDGVTSASVVILDSIGELARLFKIATLVFVGGSLVPAGGHNILEPAAFGKAIVFGPHMENFEEIAELFVERDAACQVKSAPALEEVLVALLADPVRRASLGASAQAMIDANRGARYRSLEVLAGLMPPGTPPKVKDARTLHVAP